MVHQYKLNGYNLVLDTCSGAIHVVDEVAYDVIALYPDHPAEEILQTLLAKYREEDAVPLTVDRERVARLGLELVERPVASERGSYARHDPDKLAEAVLEIYRRRAVRIFRGERRYILEE